MKKLLIILSIVVVVTIIFFIPAIINLSSKIHLKKVQNSVTEKIDTTIKNVQNFKSDSKSESENNNEVIEESNNDSNENKLNDEKITDISFVLSDDDFKDGYAILKKGKKVFYKLV